MFGVFFAWANMKSSKGSRSPGKNKQSSFKKCDRKKQIEENTTFSQKNVHVVEASGDQNINFINEDKPKVTETIDLAAFSSREILLQNETTNSSGCQVGELDPALRMYKEYSIYIILCIVFLGLIVISYIISRCITRFSNCNSRSDSQEILNHYYSSEDGSCKL